MLVYSSHGLEGMTHTFHDLYRKHLIREPWRNKPRPSLVNNWEATYFNFDTEKLLDIARTAAGRGIEMLVLHFTYSMLAEDRTAFNWVYTHSRTSGREISSTS